MFGRRRNVRYRFTASLSARLTVLRDVTIERSNDREVVAVSDQPIRIGDELLLDVPNGSRGRQRVRVIERTPVVSDMGMQYRLRLIVEV